MKVAVLAWLMLTTPVMAAEIKPPDLSPADAWQARQKGTIRVMDKLDSTVQAVTLAVGEQATIKSLTIRLTGCFVRPPDLPADAAARLAISDSLNASGGFTGWMLQKEPALNMLENPVYDVQLAGCG